MRNWQIVEGDVKSLATVVLGTVEGDLHDIGKNLVSIMMEGVGVEVFDVGVNISPQKFVEAVKEIRPQFVGMSALLTTTMPAMKQTLFLLGGVSNTHMTNIS